MLDLAYTIGIKRRFLPFYKRYSVYGHKTEVLAGNVRLVMKLDDGSTLTVPEIAKRQLKVYPDYDNAIANQEKWKRGQASPVPSAATEEAQTDGIPEGL